MIENKSRNTLTKQSNPNTKNKMKMKKKSAPKNKPTCEPLIRIQEKPKVDKCKQKNYRRQESEAWTRVSHSGRYKKAVAVDLCQDVTIGVIEECLDGITLSLSDSNSVMSETAQKRILRRIVEKRQAQAAHRKIGRSQGLFASHVQKRCLSNSMYEIHQHIRCA